ncbi:hypothetical protein [Luteibacter sp. UNCMF366Tsu5.1]|uniref:hypothetical protein n=1 Tax=Luteibacter sp. UNCMF366Tsu5.1 TaxID=1502758 RepID=UPI000908A70D|nr:hypothetical protein [Luteibacter sp. UNCMF366Tsu5.1]SFW26759.1 hypothetical protein SAMN02800691_0651 [Luteibacter sp. UNCMF366Tsu5.1]
MFFSQRMLRRSALLTPMVALGLVASPVLAIPGEMALGQPTVQSGMERTHADATFTATINGVTYVSERASATEHLGDGAVPKYHYFNAGEPIGGPHMSPMRFVRRFMDPAEQVVDGRYYFGALNLPLMLNYGEFDIESGRIWSYHPTSGHLDLTFSPDRTWVEGKFTFTAVRIDGGKLIDVDGTFAMPNTDLGL